MSVINDSEKGDELICVADFTAAPQGQRPSAQTNRSFRVGERVRYLGFFRHPNLQDNPVCWNIVFEASDGKQYAATQTLFLTKEAWQGIKKHFARRLLKDPKRASRPADQRP
jgi:hypothetical protein